jgi:hypothetical protein
MSSYAKAGDSLDDEEEEEEYVYEDDGDVFDDTDGRDDDDDDDDVTDNQHISNAKEVDKMNSSDGKSSSPTSGDKRTGGSATDLTSVPYDSFHIMESLDIEKIMRRLVNEVATLLDVSFDVSKCLLQNNKWNKEKLIESFFANSEKVMKNDSVSIYLIFIYHLYLSYLPIYHIHLYVCIITIISIYLSRKR